MKIALLPDHVINQIAAGEVIENPASVVKELVDNAIDAGASRIAIEITAGGQQLIRVEDDGSGMNRADLPLCLLRHATSKLQAVEDLDRLATMGFRGEALAAIASISQLEIRTSDGVEASRLVSEAGRILAIEPCARNRGTTLEVAALFFNAPARRKFQKSPQANAAQVTRTVQSLALAHPAIAFTLHAQGRLLLRAEARTWRGRVEELLGPEISQNGTWFEEEGLFGLLGAPEGARATRLGQHFFLNRRPLFSPLLAKALTAGYGTRLTAGVHPAAVLFLEQDPAAFDVNVHPQKREVRFKDEAALYLHVRRTIERAFLPKSLPMALPPSFSLREEAPPSFSPREGASPAAFRETLLLQERQVLQEALWAAPKGRALKLLGSFLLAERGDELLIVDLRASALEKMRETTDRQALLLPVEIALTAEEAARSEEILARAEQLGVEARLLSARHLCLDAIPTWLDPNDAASFFAVLQTDLSQGLSADDTLRRFSQQRPLKLTLFEAERLWQQKPLRERRLERTDLERILS